MKHLLNNLSEEEKNSIREQHTGGMLVSNNRFNALLENKLGNAKPLVEQFDDEEDYEFEDENEPYIDLTDEEDGSKEGLSRLSKSLVSKLMDSDDEDDFDNIDYGNTKNGLGSDDEDDYEDDYEDDFDNIDYGSTKNGLGSDDEELDEDTSWMDEL